MVIAPRARRAARSGVVATILILTAFASGASAQTGAPPPPGSAEATADNAVLLTVFLKHDQSRPLGELNAGAYHTEFYPTYDYKPMGMAEHEKAQ